MEYIRMLLENLLILIGKNYKRKSTLIKRILVISKIEDTEYVN